MMKPQGKSILPTTDLHYIGDINPFAFDNLPKDGMSFEASKASVSKLKYWKQINLKERNKLCGGTFEKVVCYRRSNIRFYEACPLNCTWGGGEGGGKGCFSIERFLISVPFF